MITRAIYVRNLKYMLDKWNAYLGKLEGKSKDLNGEVRQSFEDSLAVIRDRRDIVEQKLGLIKGAAKGAWMNLRLEAKEAREKLVEAFSKAHVQFSAIFESKSG